ncbi:MAG: prepilin-type N-terminal cleavage/methylation domain-containing protein [Patescibacteria group bacterium]
MKKNKGLTLTEVLIVVSIIVILLVLIMAFFRNQLFKGQDARRKGDLNRISIAIEEYEKDNNCYPPEALVENCNPGIGLRPYLDKIPCDPVTNSYYEIEIEESSCPSWYRIYANLTNEKDLDIEELGCTYGCGPDYAYNFYISSPNAPLPDSTTAPGATAQPSEEPGGANYYGCFDGVCKRILWDPDRPGPECDPNWQRGTCSGDECCYYQCGPELKECQDWEL